MNRLLRQSQEAFDALNSVTRRLSDLNRSLSSAPASDIRAITEEIKRLRERQSDLAAKHRNLADLCSAIDYWLASNHEPLEHLKRPIKAAPKAGETLSAAIIRIRGDIAALYRERANIQRAGIPAEDLKASAAEYVQRLRAKGAPRIIADHEQDFRVEFTFSEAWEDKGIRSSLPAILCWLDPDAFAARLHDAIDKRPGMPLTMSSSARASKLSDLEAQILQAERDEESLIEAAEESGILVMRRLDATPLAVLSLRKADPAKSKPKPARVRADAAEGTS